MFLTFMNYLFSVVSVNNRELGSGPMGKEKKKKPKQC